MKKKSDPLGAKFVHQGPLWKEHNFSPAPFNPDYDLKTVTSSTSMLPIPKKNVKRNGPKDTIPSERSHLCDRSKGDTMKNMNPTTTLKRILKVAHISPMLTLAITDTIQAIQEKNLDLAYQLTACKSHITGVLEPKNKQYAFQEDHDYNETQLKDSVYGLMDTIHHDIAWQIDKMPSGMVVASSNGKIREMKPIGIHPVVKRIRLEMNRLHREVRAKKFEPPPTRKVNRIHAGNPGS